MDKLTKEELDDKFGEDFMKEIDDAISGKESELEDETEEKAELTDEPEKDTEEQDELDDDTEESDDEEEPEDDPDPELASKAKDLDNRGEDRL